MIIHRLRPCIEDRLKHMPAVVLPGPRQVQASRREAGLTQRELVERLPKWLGWDQTTLAKAETSGAALTLLS